jgi:hypothetical protein
VVANKQIDKNECHKTVIPANQTQQQLEGSQETPVPAGEKEVCSNTQEDKMHSWMRYRNITTASNPWKAVYKLATGKIKNRSSFSTLKKPDRTVTSDTADTMHFMIGAFTPEDDEMDNKCHNLIRAQIKEPIKTEDDKLFTTIEIRDALKGMNKNKAPGEDGIMSNILLRAFNLLPRSTTALYNGCLRMPVFPEYGRG